MVPRFVHALQGNFVDAIACGYNFSMAVTQKVCVCVCVCVCERERERERERVNMWG